MTLLTALKYLTLDLSILNSASEAGLNQNYSYVKLEGMSFLRFYILKIKRESFYFPFQFSEVLSLIFNRSRLWFQSFCRGLVRKPKHHNWNLSRHVTNFTKAVKMKVCWMWNARNHESGTETADLLEKPPTWTNHNLPISMAEFEWNVFQYPEPWSHGDFSSHLRLAFWTSQPSNFILWLKSLEVPLKYSKNWTFGTKYQLVDHTVLLWVSIHLTSHCGGPICKLIMTLKAFLRVPPACMS